MAKRGYKLQEFVAHTTNLNCLNMGKKTCRLLITGGDDHKVNVWAIGKPTSLMSLCGHTSPVESLAFNSPEVLVLAGSSTGGIKLWDLEETKMLRGLTGHSSNCTALEFHPFGELFASGSMDPNLKVWDIRKKGCIHKYKGHTRGISTIRFTPDGRWVVSGGFDNIVKIWDLTAGKLLNELKFHEGHIRAIDFHPLEFLLATGSADRTVKFWDLETFELIGSTRPEANGVRSIAFHPDGRTLFCGADDGLKVYSWEPVVSHDSLDMGWSTLGDLCINEGKLLGCSYYRNSVGVWAADVAHIEPYGRADKTEKKFNLERSYSSVKAGSVMRSTLGLRPLSPDCETKEIKNIYIDTAGSNPISTRKEGSLNSPKKMSLPVDACEISNLETEKPRPGTKVNVKSNEQSGKKSFITLSVVPLENPIVKETGNSAKESITFSRTKPGMLLKPAHVRRPSINKFEVEKLSAAVESGTLRDIKSGLDSEQDMNSQTWLVSEDEARKSCDEKGSNIKTVIEKSEKVLSTQTPPNQETCDESLTCIKDSNPVKIVRGVAVVSGRTRTLVEKFERRERLNSSDDAVTNSTPPAVSETDRTPAIKKGEIQISETKPVSANDVNKSESQISRVESTSSCEGSITEIQISKGDATPASDGLITGDQISIGELSSPPYRIITGDQISRGELSSPPDSIITENRTSRKGPTITPERIIIGNQISRRESNSASSVIITGNLISRRESNSASSGTITGNQFSRSRSTSASTGTITGNQTRRESTSIASGIISRNQLSRRETTSANDRSGPNGTITSDNHIARRGLSSANDGNVTIIESQISKGLSISSDNGNIAESLMQTHDIFVSTLRSRLTKLQVVRHFWEKNDIKGAIGALQKLPDYSVQADVISVLTEKMEILTLDLFSGLLPVLMGLLDSKTERHVNISLEMLLKLVAVFGSMIRSTVSAPRGVGIDLHAEQRRECCNQCFVELQKIQKLLPLLVRRGGVIGRCAQELNLVLQE